MDLRNLTYQGPPVDDPATLHRLPADYRRLLEQINGFIQFGGGLHIRGACMEPVWNALAPVWSGPHAFSTCYPSVAPSDIPFGQDALGDQFLLRDGLVYRLAAETGELEALDRGLFAFLEAAQADPVEYLALHPLLRFQREGGALRPGELLSVYPPFCTAESAGGVSLRAVPAMERIGFLAELAEQLRGVPEQGKVTIKIGD